jgi:hypothetical protein
LFHPSKGFICASQTVSRATELKLFSLHFEQFFFIFFVSIILLIFAKQNQVNMSELDPLCGYTEESGARAPTYNHYNRMKKSLTGRRNCKLVTFSVVL